MVKVSIVVPVYNTKIYLKRCIDSILSQSFKDFELILINDGSTDGSINILREYEKVNKKVKVIDKKNEGPALARNMGINIASGKYIMFIDSDDYIDSNYISNYYNSVVSGDFNVVIGGYKRVVGDKIKYTLRLKQGEFSKYMVTGPVCRIIKRDFIVKNNINFLDTNSSEDVYFNIMLYNATDKIKIIDDTGYNYFYNANSLSNTIHKGFNEDVKVIELLDLINVDKSFNLEINQYYIIRYIIWYLLYSGKNSSYDRFIKEYNKLFNWLDNNIPSYKKNQYLSLFKLEGEPVKYRLIILIFMFIHKFRLIKLFAKVYCKGGK